MYISLKLAANLLKGNEKQFRCNLTCMRRLFLIDLQLDAYVCPKLPLNHLMSQLHLEQNRKIKPIQFFPVEMWNSSEENVQQILRK